MAYDILWDQQRFPEGVAFPDGDDNWPTWLIDAIYTFAASEKPGPSVVVTFVQEPPHVRLVATEPNLKKLMYAVALVPGEDEDTRILVVSEVERL